MVWVWFTAAALRVQAPLNTLAAQPRSARGAFLDSGRAQASDGAFAAFSFRYCKVGHSYTDSLFRSALRKKSPVPEIRASVLEHP